MLVEVGQGAERASWRFASSGTSCGRTVCRSGWVRPAPRPVAAARAFLEQRLLVELDGRLGHAGWAGRGRIAFMTSRARVGRLVHHEGLLDGRGRRALSVRRGAGGAARRPGLERDRSAVSTSRAAPWRRRPGGAPRPGSGRSGACSALPGVVRTQSPPSHAPDPAGARGCSRPMDQIPAERQEGMPSVAPAELPPTTQSIARTCARSAGFRAGHAPGAVNMLWRGSAPARRPAGAGERCAGRLLRRGFKASPGHGIPAGQRDRRRGAGRRHARLALGWPADADRRLARLTAPAGCRRERMAG